MTNYIINRSDTRSSGAAGDVLLTIDDADNLYVAYDGWVIAWGADSTGVRVTAPAAGQRVDVEGFVRGTAFGIDCLGSGNAIGVYGRVSSDAVGIRLEGGGNRLTVGPGGIIEGVTDAVQLNAGSTMANAGTILGSIRLEGIGSAFVNTGEILSASGPSVLAQGTSMRIVNQGEIVGGLDSPLGNGLNLVNSGRWLGDLRLTGGGDVVRNAGEIDGDVRLGESSDLVVNSGLILSNCLLGAGDDRYDGRHGRISLAVVGDDGADTILGGADGEDAIGGAGADFIQGADGHDVINGGKQADRLLGGSGDDLLLGGSHGDILTGGAGADTMDGGLHKDTFVFRPGFGHDLIQHFVASGDQADTILFSRAVFKNFNQLSSNMNDVGDDVVIKAGADTLVLDDVEKADLDRSDFGFVA